MNAARTYIFAARTYENDGATDLAVDVAGEFAAKAKENEPADRLKGSVAHEKPADAWAETVRVVLFSDGAPEKAA